MATSGEADFSGSVSEEFEYKHTCLPCETEGQKRKAVGYCQSCKEFLCQRCYDAHLIPSIARRHVLVNEENMVDIATAEATKNKCSERCQQHKKSINYHCPTHAFFGCHVCYFNGHNSCTGVQYIPVASQNIAGTTRYQEFNTSVANITEKGSKLIAEIKTATETNTTCYNKAVTGIKDFKKELLDAIDKLEKELLEKADKAKKDRAQELSRLTDKVNNVMTENQKIASQTELLLNKHQHCDLYTAMVQLKDKLLALEDDLNAAEGDKCSQYFEYNSNNELLETLKSPFGLGTLSETNTITDVKHLMDINCKTESDTSDCDIWGCVLLPGDKLVLTDRNNHKVKLLDTKQSKVIADIKVPNAYSGVCKVTDTQVAVATYTEQKIVLVETNPSLSISRELKVDGRCQGVDYLEGKLVVSYYNPHKVEILDLQGTVLKKIETDDKGQKLFYDPNHLAINSYTKLIYVSNWGSKNIVCMLMDGTVIAKYTDSELQGPWQVITDKTGKVFACGYNSGNVHQITEDCRKVKVILSKAHGLTNPRSIAYSEKDGTLYIGQYSNDLKLFKLTFKTL